MNFLKSCNPKLLKQASEQTFLFITAILNQDIILLDSLLSEKFTYFDNKSKKQTLRYFKKQFSMPIPEEFYSKKVKTLFCKGCRPGDPALLFHYGYWPILENEEFKPKSIILSFNEGMISDLTFCFSFCNADGLQEISIQN